MIYKVNIMDYERVVFTEHIHFLTTKLIFNKPDRNKIN